MLDLIDDDISSHDSDSEDYSEDVEKIDLYRENILKNPLDYDSHFKLIKALRYAEKCDEVREAREQMSKYYPLSPEMWLEWINDEKANNTDKDFLHQLFIRATNDYRSVDVWLEFCQFSIGYLKDKSETRQFFETALTQVGTHLLSGYLLWGTYILYENTMLFCEKNPEEIAEQRKRIYKLYLRQLSIPLEGNEDIYNEFLEWNNGDTAREDEIKLKYEESKKLLEKYRTFEDKISNATVEYAANKTGKDSESKEEHWLAYLQYAEDNFTKSETINLFERSLTEICLSQNIWMKYLQYLCRYFEKDGERILTAYKRSVRNYKSSLEIWLGLVRYMENYESPVEEIRQTFDSIFRETLVDQAPFLPLWQAYLDFEKRQLDKQSSDRSSADSAPLDLAKIRALFDRLYAIDNYTDYDPQCALIKYWAFVEAKYGANLPKSRELWGQIMKTLGNTVTNLWLEYLDFERRFGDFNHLKRAANNAVNCFPDYPEYLFERVLRMVAEDGDLASYLHFGKKIGLQLKKINERRLADETQRGQVNAAKHQKRKAPDMKSPDSKAKRVKFVNDTPAAAPAQPIVNIEPANKNPVEKCNEKSVYVSNLNYRVNEDDLRAKFGKCGTLADIRIAKDNAGKSRGFAYIQYENIADVEEALKLERDLLMERPMFVTRNNPDKRHSFQFAVGVVEKSKLFIKNLTKTVTKHALETIFGAYGTLKDVRIVTFRSGAPKGIAYVEFFNEDDASKALVGTDGMLIGDKAIEVNISKPPPKSTAAEDSVPAEPPSHVSNSFIVPRAVQKPMMTQKKIIHGTGADTKDKEIELPKRSNDDFRKFLL